MWIGGWMGFDVDEYDIMLRQRMLVYRFAMLCYPCYLHFVRMFEMCLFLFAMLYVPPLMSHVSSLMSHVLYLMSYISCPCLVMRDV